MMWGRRVRSLVRLAARRVAGRTSTAPQRVLVTVLGVALAVGLMVTVTGISLGLASQSVVESEGVDYWLLPEDASVQSVAVSSGGPRLGSVHASSERIAADPRVEYAIPVGLELLPVSDGTTGERRYLLAVGVVARPGAEILGVPLDHLAPGDPYFADGSYDGAWTGEVVLNDAAAAVTNLTAGSRIALAGRDAPGPLTVVNVTDSEAATGVGSTPVALVHLSELQRLTGATGGDQADQILVGTDSPGVKDYLADLYPRTSVVTRSGIAAQEVSTSNLPLAVAVAALVVAVVVGVLFVTTLMGLEVSASREQLGALSAVGFSGRSLAVLVAAETVVLALLGGGVGLVLGWLGIVGVNRLGDALVGTGTVAVFDPLLIGYALVVAAAIGVVGAIYPALLGRRARPSEVLSR